MVADSFNETEGTVTYRFATETPVLRYDWNRDEYFDEVLSIDPEAMSLKEANRSAGLPFITDHNTWSVHNVIGRTTKVWIEGGAAYAEVRFSKAEEHQTIIQNIRDGILPDCSVGYVVRQYKKEEKRDGQPRRTYRATNWYVREISTVVVPADPESYKMRSSDKSQQRETIEVEIIETEEPVMNNEPKNTPDAPNSDELKRAAIEAERQRTLEIYEIAKAKPDLLDENWVKERIRSGESLDLVRKLALAEISKREFKPGPSTSVSTVGNDRALEGRREAMINGMMLRSGQLPDEMAKLNKDARREAEQFRKLSLIGMARESLDALNISTRGYSDEEIIGRAFTQTNSDFPVVLEAVIQRTLQGQYALQADKWRRFCKVGNVNNFQDVARIRLGSLDTLSDLLEGEEIASMAIPDGVKTTIGIGTKAKMISVTRNMIINDDLGAFLDIAAWLGMAAALTIEKDVFACLNARKFRNDTDVFTTANNNIVATGTAPSVDVLDGMKLLMSQQTDISGNHELDIEPAIAIVPRQLETRFKVLNASTYNPDVSNKSNPINPVQNIVRDIVASSRLTGNGYYLFADPNLYPTIEVSFLRGQQAPQIKSEEGFTILGTKYRVFLDYGVNFVDHRTAVYNPGA